VKCQLCSSKTARFQGNDNHQVEIQDTTGTALLVRLPFQAPAPWGFSMPSATQCNRRQPLLPALRHRTGTGLPCWGHLSMPRVEGLRVRMELLCKQRAILQYLTSLPDASKVIKLGILGTDNMDTVVREREMSEMFPIICSNRTPLAQGWICKAKAC